MDGAGIQFIDARLPPVRICKCLEFLNDTSDGGQSLRQFEDFVVEIIDSLEAFIFEFRKWSERLEGRLHAVGHEPLLRLCRRQLKRGQH
jgi:hypothetical protein